MWDPSQKSFIIHDLRIQEQATEVHITVAPRYICVADRRKVLVGM